MDLCTLLVGHLAPLLVAFGGALVVDGDVDGLGRQVLAVQVVVDGDLVAGAAGWALVFGAELGFG